MAEFADTMPGLGVPDQLLVKWFVDPLLVEAACTVRIDPLKYFEKRATIR